MSDVPTTRGQRGQRSTEAFVLFEQGKSIGDAAMSMGVKYATARVWWLLWRVAELEEQIELAEIYLSDGAPASARRVLRGVLGLEPVKTRQRHNVV